MRKGKLMNEPRAISPGEQTMRLCSLILLVVTTTCALFLSWWIFRTSTQFSKIFADFGAQLPALTSIVCSPWYRWLVPLVAVIGIVKEPLVPSGRWRMIWNGIQLWILAVLGGLTLMGVLTPLGELIERLSG
jgi:hypothetical protein